MKGVSPSTFIAKAEAEAKEIDDKNALGEDEDAPKTKATRVIMIPNDLFNEFVEGVSTEK